MNSKSANNVMMDLVRLETEVRKKAKIYLDRVTEDSLKDFAESTKNIAHSVLENYFLTVDDVYTHGALKIEDGATFDRFIDFHDGYRARMKRWASENEITIGKMVVNPALKYPELKDENVRKEPMVIAGVGTIVAVGLFIFTETWIAVAAELLALAYAVYTYKKRRKACREEFDFKVKEYEIEMERERASLINGLIKDLKKWLGNAESFSKSILSDFGIK